MLQELHIRNLAIIDDLDLTFGPGFNVLTGESGAGKSIVIDAVYLLLGDRASQEVVRAGAERTVVEGTFQLDQAEASRVAALLAEHELEGDRPDVLVLGREVRANGRSVARINGRSVSTLVLGEVGGQLVDVHGQGEHLSLLREREHAGFLDRYAGLEVRRREMAELVQRLRAVRRELDDLRQDARERARRIDLLTYQVEEIRAAKLRAGEAEELEGERQRLGNAEHLAELSVQAMQALRQGDTEEIGALDALGVAEQALARLARIDPGASGLAEQLAEATALLDDLARELGRYLDGIEFNPQRLEQAEERLQLIHGLLRKYGDTIAEIIAYSGQAAGELATISNAEGRIAELEGAETDLLRSIGLLGAEISAVRRAAGERLARAIEDDLTDLQMQRARFAVQIAWTTNAAGAFVTAEAARRVGEMEGRYAFDGSGLDGVSFLVSANPGEPLRPLVRVASGGETSRLMLALKSVLGRADETPTLIFDEIDQGIGGPVGGTVGRKLWGLTRSNDEGVRHQVLCVTHLPQLAAFGDVHFHVAKRLAGERTVTEVIELLGEARVGELARMLGADSAARRASVAEMMAEVDVLKRAGLRRSP